MFSRCSRRVNLQTFKLWRGFLSTEAAPALSSTGASDTEKLGGSKSQTPPFDATQITLTTTDGSAHTVSTCWLRDNCICPECFQRQQRSLQRLESGFVPKTCEIKSITRDAGRLNVTWMDGHKSKFDVNYLSQHILGSMKRPEVTNRFLWTRDSLIQERPQKLNFDACIHDEKTLKMLGQELIKFGFCEIIDAPVERESLTAVLNQVGGPLSTLFSEADDATMDLTNNDRQNDLGWTDKRVPAHTDFTFYHNPSALVGLHLLYHDGVGGEFAIVDGFQVAEKFRREQPEVFRHMVHSPILWKYISDGQEERLISTIMRLDSDNRACQHFKWSPVYIYPLHAESVTETESLYRALAAIYHEIHVNEENRHDIIPEPGRITVFDNWRMIHERKTDFTGKRIMHVGDVPRDAWINRARQLGVM